ncbi:hypothetical protein KQH65_07080 [archaeon]|nr:hypothetical protein [archaeon]
MTPIECGINAPIHIIQKEREAPILAVPQDSTQILLLGTQINGQHHIPRSHIKQNSMEDTPW